LLKRLGSKEKTGIIGDKDDLIRRKKKYGENSPPKDQPVNFRQSIITEIKENRIYWALAACGAVSMLTGAIS